MNIDASFLHPGYQTDRKEGFYAEFSSSGQLTHFGYYINGKPQGWVLYLSPEHEQGRAEYIKEFSAEQERGGGWDDSDYSSDEQITSDADLYCMWVESRIRDIYEGTNTAFRCSFCGKYQSEVERLIAGPQVYICSECIQLCNEILDEEAQSNSPTAEPTA